jgi:hypothetical protein
VNDDDAIDLSRLKARRSTVGDRFKRPISLRVPSHALEYFQELSEEVGVPYQTLINLALLDYAKHGRRPVMDWKVPGSRRRGPRGLAAKKAARKKRA